MTLDTRHSSSVRFDWPPFEIVIFDCDSTLCTVEGIDELARWIGKEAEVAALTQRAMNGELPLEAVYSQRLEMLNPTREHLQRLGRLYQETLIPDAAQVIAALKRLGRAVFIVSGGLAEGVREFGVWLGLPESHIFAVEVEYNQLAGRWWETWKYPGGRNPDERYLTHDGGPLTVGKGKAQIIRNLRRRHRGRAMLIGDGISDLEAGEAVDLFVGFGGVIAREKVKANAEVFIHAPRLTPVLPLALARPAAPPPDQELYAQGLALIQQGQVTFQDPAAREGLIKRIYE
jgi:phosphoserine phosphatase